MTEALLPASDQQNQQDSFVDVSVNEAPLRPSNQEDVEQPVAPLLNAQEEGTNRRGNVDPLLLEEQDEGERARETGGILSPVARFCRKCFLPEPSVTSDDEEASLVTGSDNNDTATITTGHQHEPDLLDIVIPGWSILVSIENRAFAKSAIFLVLTTVGLQASYLLWGYEMEFLMTTKFDPTDSVPDGKFPSAAFCVWTNRVVALIVSSFVVVWRQRGVGCFQRAPLCAFSPIALSTTLGSYFQFASLKFVSFPVMTVARSLKIVTVMITSSLVNGTKYAGREYVEAVLITIGTIIFSLASKSFSRNARSSVLVGYLLIVAFLFSDALAITWQGKIYQTYGRRNVDPFQMMLGANVFSAIFTTLGLLMSGEFGVVFNFLRSNLYVVKHLLKMGVASCVGQICGFVIIKEFGPVVYTIIMTIRQMLSIILSFILFRHPTSVLAVISAALVFCTIAFQIRRNYILARDPQILES